jgi:secreted PhoX family phosphatase
MSSKSKPAAGAVADEGALSRRRLFAGAGTVGALAAAAAVVPMARREDAAVAQAEPAADAASGYSLTDHVQHYYQTARV